jgi:hypothetical protein
MKYNTLLTNIFIFVIMDALTPSQKIIFIQQLGLKYDVQPILNELEPADAIELIDAYDLDFDINSFIGKTDSHLLLEKAVKLNDIELVKQCLYCKCDSYFLTNVLKYCNDSDIINILSDKVKLEIDCYSFPRLCKLNHNVIVKIYNMCKDELDKRNFSNEMCKSSSDETFLYFYDSIKDNADCFLSVIQSGKLERVKMMMHLYGKQTDFDIKYKREYNLKTMENLYLSTSCFTGNLEMVKYFMSIRNFMSKRDVTCDNCIHNACKSGNLELIQYLYDLGFKPEHVSKTGYYNNIDKYPLPVFEWVLQHGIGPLTYTHNYDYDDYTSCNEKIYDFYNMVKQKKIDYLTVLQKYCNEEEFKKVVEYIVANWTDGSDDVLLPFITDLQFFSDCKSMQLIIHFMTLGIITEEQWTDLFFNMINEDVSKYTPIINYYRYKLNLSLLASKFKEYRFGLCLSAHDKQLVAKLLQIEK